MPVKVVVADDHHIMRQSLVSMLQKEAQIEVVGEAADGRATVRLCQKVKPDVVIMDVGLPDLNGIEATRQILAECPETKVIGLSMHSTRLFVVKMMKAGASGYLPKSCTFRELVDAIAAVQKGQVYLSPAVAGFVVQGIMEPSIGVETESTAILTPREREVMQLLVEGKTPQQIASLLFVSLKTVEAHRRNLMEKLKIRTLAELTKYAIREGITTLDI